MAGLDDAFFGPPPEEEGTEAQPVADTPIPEAAPEETVEPVAEDLAEDTEAEDPETPVTRGRLAAVLAERDKRQAAERVSQDATARAEAAERRIVELEGRQQAPQAQPQAQAPPDPVMEPEQFAAWVQAQQRAPIEKLSGVMAVKEYGLEKVKAAEVAIRAAIARDPTLRAELNASDHPYDFAVTWHQKQQFRSEIGDVDSMDALIEREAVKRGYVKAGGAAPAQTTITTPRPQTPAPSLAGVAAARPGEIRLQPDPLERKLFGSS